MLLLSACLLFIISLHSFDFVNFSLLYFFVSLRTCLLEFCFIPDEEIDAVRLELKKYGIQMPAFQKIGGILANDLAADAAVLHAAIIAINEAIDSQVPN